MQSFLRRLRPISVTELEAAVRAISAASVSQACERLSTAAREMNLSELRGYARARARRVVLGEMQKHFVGCPGLSQQVLDRVLTKVLDQVAQQLVRERMLAPARADVRRAA